MRLSANVKEQLAAEGKAPEEETLRAAFPGRVPAIFFLQETQASDQEMFVVRLNETGSPQREPVCMLDVAGEIELNKATQYLADSLGKAVYGIRFVAYDIASVAYPRTEAPEG